VDDVLGNQDIIFRLFSLQAIRDGFVCRRRHKRSRFCFGKILNKFLPFARRLVFEIFSLFKQQQKKSHLRFLGFFEDKNNSLLDKKEDLRQNILYA
jgi:hypothetical protein